MPRCELVICDDADVPGARVDEYVSTRRRLVASGLLGSGAVLGVSALPFLLSVRNAFAQVSGDERTIAAAVGLEQTMAFAYAAALGAPGLDRATRTLLTLFQQHEQQHVGAMITNLEQVAGTAPPGPRSTHDLQGVALSLARGANRRSILTFAAELEANAIAAYSDGQRQLKDARTLESSATIMAAEAQHLVALRTALGRDPIPRALERGLV